MNLLADIAQNIIDFHIWTYVCEILIIVPPVKSKLAIARSISSIEALEKGVKSVQS